MRILAPYVNMHQSTDALLREYAPSAERVYTGDSFFSYWEAISERWTGTEDLVIIEQDVGITPSVIPQFLKCQRDWCTFWYYYAPGHGTIAPQPITWSIGCVKFSAKFQRRYPAEVISPEPQGWQRIDGVIAEVVNPLQPHVHDQVRHFHKYDIVYLDPPGTMPRHFLRKSHKALIINVDGQVINIENEYGGLVVDSSTLDSELSWKARGRGTVIESDDYGRPDPAASHYIISQHAVGQE